MPGKNPIARPTLKSIDSYVQKHAPQVGAIQKHQHMASETIRGADYEGHHIVVRTTYQLEVDGKPVMGHMGVTDDGKVHYHPVPTISFASALDMVKQLIDIFPDDFADMGKKSAEHEGHAISASPPGKPAAPAAPAARTRRAKKAHTGHK